MRCAPLLLLIVALSLPACRQNPEAPKAQQADDTKRGFVSDTAMVVSAHPLASAAGVEVLRKGGNAVDAAVAVHFALAVVLPAAGNLGGGGFLLSRQANGQVHTLDYRETAPAAAQRDMYLDAEGKVIPDLSFLGHLAAGVPGSVAGMAAAHDSLGTLPWDELIQPAIALAEKGFALTAREAEGLNEARARFLRFNTQTTAYTSRSLWQAGDSIRHPELAQTLMRIRDEGAAGFYEGKTAQLIEAEMKRGKGLISAADLKNYRPVWRPPVRGSYKAYEVIGMGPPSSGGIALLQLLGMTEAFPLDRYGLHSANAAHVIIEAERRVYADRAAHLGDSDFYPVPLRGLLDAGYLRERMQDFSPERATSSDSVLAGNPPAEHEQTTHFSIVDGKGNAVAVTTTLNGSYGTHVVVAGAGFILNNEMDDFSVKPGYANAYGLVGAEANAIAPGKRMLSSMTPTIVTRNDSLYMVLGTPGGSTIITSVFQVMLNVIAYNMGMQEAVNAARFHHQWKPDKVFCEEGAFSRADSLQLVQRGHSLKIRTPIGRMDAILVLPDGRLEGGADPRGDDSAAGF